MKPTRHSAILRAIRLTASAVASRAVSAAFVVYTVLQRMRLRTRVMTFVGIALVAWAGVSVISALSTVGEVREDFRNVSREFSGLTAEQLTEPATFFRIAEASEDLERSISKLDTPLLFLGSVGWVPYLGTRANAPGNTAKLGRRLAYASSRIFRVYGESAAQRSSVGSTGMAEVLAENRGFLVEADRALAEAQALLAKPQMLSEQDAIVLGVGLSTLRAFALIGIEAPESVDDAFALVQGMASLQNLVERPLEVLADTSGAKRRVALVQSSAGRLQASMSRLVEGDTFRGDDLATMSSALSAIVSIADAATAILEITDALQEGALSPAFGAAVGPKLLQSRERITEAKLRLATLEGRLGATKEANPSAVPGSDVFASVTHGLNRAETTVQALRALLGFEGPRTYLLILQNQNEIRATGGFLGATAELRLENGVLSKIIYEDSTRLDPTPLINNPQAPEPLYWYLWMGRLLFRDANWNPDFPTSARTIIDLYEHARGVRADGVFAATKLLGLDIVGLFDDIVVPGVEAPLTRELAFQYMEDLAPYECRPDQVSTRGKRCFDEDLLPAIIDRLQSGIDDRELDALVGVVQRQLDEKNILLYVVDQDADTVIGELGWSGAMPSPSQDMLMVVDSSLPGHTTAAVTRVWDYRVVVNPQGTNKARLYLQYLNSRAVRDPDCRQAAEGGGGCYWNYARIYLSPWAEQVQAPPIPLHEGSEKLIWGHRDVDSLQISTHGSGALRGLVEVGAYVTVHPNTMFTLPISYDLNQKAVRTVGPRKYEYRLLLVKQPGVDRDEVQVEVVLPEGAKVVDLNPASAQAAGHRMVWEGLLERDTLISVVFQLP